VSTRRALPSPSELATGVLAGDRGLLARAITLVEGRRADQRAAAQELLERLLPESGRARRIGITGVPGAGKSTLIEALGLARIAAGSRVAVLAVDPSSTLSGGSILGDKSRMNALAQRSEAFIRPSPSAASLGGVARRTREVMLLCEAAGFDLVLVETQGIKKGVLELADVVAVNKADGDGMERAELAARQLQSALSLGRGRHAGWRTPVRTVSARTGHGLDELWADLDRLWTTLESDGRLAALRREQRSVWLWGLLRERLEDHFRAHPGVRARLATLEQGVLDGAVAPGRAAEELLALFSPGQG
jgi:LAO/AO transport system kinase